MAWHAKEVVHSIYDHTDPHLALEFVARLGHDSKTRVAHRRSVNWAGRFCGGVTRSPPGIRPASPTDPLKRPTTCGQEGQAGRVRVHEVPELPHPGTALRRQAQLGATPDITPRLHMGRVGQRSNQDAWARLVVLIENEQVEAGKDED